MGLYENITSQGRAAEFRCQFPADADFGRELQAKIPLPADPRKSCTSY